MTATTGGTPTPARQPRPFVTPAEVLIVLGVLFTLSILHKYAEGGFDQFIDATVRLFFFGAIAYFIGRRFWRWWTSQPAKVARMGALVGLGVAVVGWLDVGLATWVMGINEGNYGLIFIGPAAMLIGLAVSVAGMLAAGLGVAVVMTGLRHAMPGRFWIIGAGIATVILNLAPIACLLWIYSHP